MKKNVSAATLKTVAMLLMLVNHACLALFTAGGYQGFWWDFQWFVTRAGFVLFAFLIAEGMRHTHDRKRYLLRLGLLALVSEVPYDLLMSGSAFNPGSNNVLITLFLGALGIMLAENYAERGRRVLAGAFAALLASCAFADYGAMGVMVILLFYFLRNQPGRMFLGVALALFLGTALPYLPMVLADGAYVGEMLYQSTLELHGALAFPLIACYSGQKGRALPKLFCYLFYPVHLLALYGLTALLF